MVPWRWGLNRRVAVRRTPCRSGRECRHRNPVHCPDEQGQLRVADHAGLDGGRLRWVCHRPRGFHLAHKRRRGPRLGGWPARVHGDLGRRLRRHFRRHDPRAARPGLPHRAQRPPLRCHHHLPQRIANALRAVGRRQHYRRAGPAVDAQPPAAVRRGTPVTRPAIRAQRVVVGQPTCAPDRGGAHDVLHCRCSRHPSNAGKPPTATSRTALAAGSPRRTAKPPRIWHNAASHRPIGSPRAKTRSLRRRSLRRSIAAAPDRHRPYPIRNSPPRVAVPATANDR